MVATAHHPRRVTSALYDVVAVLILWALVVAMFWRIVLAGRVLASGDIFTYFFPYWSESTRALQGGRLPLWNEFLFAGAPFLANSQAGLLYPPNWPLWFFTSADRSVHLSPVLHIGLAATGAYLLARLAHGCGHIGAWTTGLVFALGGYLTAQFEHVNQVQGLAWFPFALLLCDLSFVMRARVAKRSVAAYGGLVIVISLIMLAGHTQTAFVVLVGLAVYSLGVPAVEAWRSRKPSTVLRPLVLLLIAAGLGAGIAAVQLVPTWELSRYSIRAGGLPFAERVSFSLSPLYLTRALLPGFSEPVPPARLEHVAYVGISGLILALSAVLSRRARSRVTWRAVALVVVGLVLSLGGYNPFYLPLARYVPGFAHFRVPARWLALYAIGVAALAGQGAQALWDGRASAGSRKSWVALGAMLLAVAWAVFGVRVAYGSTVNLTTAIAWTIGSALAVAMLVLARRRPRAGTTLVLCLLVVELLSASVALPHARATAPQAFTSLRPAIAHLKVHQPGRFLGMSDISFDPGDLGELNAIYGPQLGPGAYYDLVIATKHKEVLTPNLPLAFEVRAVDGYDGGLLPLARYAKLQALLLGPENGSLDGRLRENLTTVPDGPWLNMLDVRYVVTDKLQDAWIDDVFYDLQFEARLADGGEVAVAEVVPFEATAIGVVSRLEGADNLPDGTLVGLLTVSFQDGVVAELSLRAGEHTSEADYGPRVRHTKASVGAQTGNGPDARFDYASRVGWGDASEPVDIQIAGSLPEGELVISGLSLIDERTGSFQSLVVSDQASYRLAHSGDVKIYENLDATGQAHAVTDLVWVDGDDEALEAMLEPGFDPTMTVVLDSSSAPAEFELAQEAVSGCGSLPATTIEEDGPEQQLVTVDSCAPAILVVSRAWYPGWRAWVDGAEQPVLRANLLLSAVAVSPGSHSIIYAFRPPLVAVGLASTLVSLICLVALLLTVLRCRAVRRML